ncbi:ubiquinone-dependent pyruvate dehydrogenase [Polymorphobacter sp. PAMC 29334]|uniref:ubiquinone-dependent pyruvate dehydrogenase n=1 Tax=Polymorphobacter sp. PAMC 29334 TaxID=2862331 RepID=UPI001C74D108|nr:ubiquinone-dependent pyruvate dehydrogenase [Polymorphobacter sp. PAMC 29334]QYE35632.1 ubiquinone-dependent pyruvate dehydrogenase [Polymorphobacter sp. PAMC 29334]
MSTSNIAEMIVAMLHRAGVKRIYGIAGDSLNAVTEAVRKHGEIEWVHVRNEEVGAFAAGGEAHLTGSLVVCAGSCGPGNLHLVNGLYDCHRSRVPVLAIAAQIPSAEIGRGYFQETRPEQLFRECSYYCEMISTSKQLPGVVETAIRVAIAKRGVSVLVLPGDVAGMAVDEMAAPSPALILADPLVRPGDTELVRLAGLLDAAGRVTMLCGRGCADARPEMLQLAEVLKAPIVHALGGKESVEWDNPYDVGMTGFIGFSSGYQAMNDCDMLLMLGTDFPYRQFYPNKATIAQVDLRPENLGRRCRLDFGLIGDVRATIDALLPRLEPKRDRTHLDRSLARYREARKGLDDLAVGRAGRKPMHPQFVAKTLSDMASDDAVFTFDVGTTTIWAARYFKMNGKRRLVGSLNHGSMANALPQAIGAQAAYPDRQIISFSGDGGFAMLMGDLLTLTQKKLPVKIVVLNNGTLGFVELEMKAAGMLDVGVALENPDFAAVATAAGIFARRVEDPADLPGALAAVLTHPGPALLDAVTARHELSLPPKIEIGQIAGFGLWTAKAVLNGQGNEVVELARTALLR